MRDPDGDSDSIVTAFAEPADGPGWSNAPVWVVIRSRDGTLRMECLQPEDQTPDIYALYRVSAAAHASMTAAARAALVAEGGEG